MIVSNILLQILFIGFALLFKVIKPEDFSLLDKLLTPYADFDSAATATKSTVPTLPEIKYYNNFAAAVYCHDPELSDWTCAPCKKTKNSVRFVAVINNEVYNTRAIVLKDLEENEIIIAFRGTVNLRNTMLDLLIAPTMEPSVTNNGIKVHYGSWLAMRSLYNKVTSVLRKELESHSSYSKVIITGHSLGGMEASLFLLNIRHDAEFQSLPFQLYSFGQPRTGNQAFAAWMNSQTFNIIRVISRSDIAGQVMTPYNLGYVHFNTELWLKENGTHTSCNRNVFEDPTCSSSEAKIYQINIADHFKYFDTDYTACYDYLNKQFDI